MLQNAYFLAKIGADTAENEQHFAEILPKIGNYPTGPRSRSGREADHLHDRVLAHVLGLERLAGARAAVDGQHGREDLAACPI